jgi:hypothetical protein
MGIRVILGNGGNRVDKSRISTLKEVADELGVSYKVAWGAAKRGELPAVQLFGPGSSWLVTGNFRDYISKSSGPADMDDSEDFKAG